MDKLAFLLLLLVRLASVFLIITFFLPDEYWQSLEVAHRLTFGYGYLTWEWTRGIRSYFYPSIFAVIYKVLDVLKIDERLFLILLPRILQALLSAYADYRFYEWCNRKKWSLFIIATNWFWFYTGSRTLINSFEAALTTIALSYFPWGEADERIGFLWITALLAYIRPTSIITWIPLCIFHIKKSRYSSVDLLAKRYLFIGLITGGVLAALDSFLHGSFIITPYEFFKANIFEGVGSYYGVHPWYWYLNTGLPAVLGILIVPFFLSVFTAIKSWDFSKTRQVLLISIISTIFVYSLLPHKEFRFLMQILPLCFYCIVQFLSEWSRTKSTLVIWMVAMVILVSNVVPAGYLGFVYQQGAVKVMDNLATIATDFKTQEGRPAKILFLMPCHSTPYYSHIHANVSMRFLTCEPNFKNEENYLDEADKFYKAPMKWIRSHLPVHPVSALPTHVVVYDSLVLQINEFLSIYKLREIIFHSDHLVSYSDRLLSSRLGNNIMIFERNEQILKKNEKETADEDEIEKPTTRKPSQDEL